MNTEKRLGKIEAVSFGIGGYQDAMIGLHITLTGEGWGTCTTQSAWDAELIKHTKYCNWTEEERSEQYAEIVRYLSKLFKQAKVKDVQELKGILIEATFEGMSLKEWRVLTEVM